MYKKPSKQQSTFFDFNQPMGLKMNPDNRWVKMADSIPWDIFEEKYAGMFPSMTGNVAKPLRMALGTLIIQTKFQYADRELVEQITENPYLQYFIGLLGYQDSAPFDASTLVLFRKRITMKMIQEVYCAAMTGGRLPGVYTKAENLSPATAVPLCGPNAVHKIKTMYPVRKDSDHIYHR